MNQRPLRAKWWFVQGLTVLALVATFALYFLVYVPSRAAYLTERNFRLLGDMSEQIRESLAGLHSALTNAATRLTGSPVPDRLEQFTNAVGLIEPRVTLLGAPTRCGAGHSRAVNIRATPGLKGYSLILTYTNELSRTNLTVGVDLGELLRPIMNRYDFEDILLAETNGEVIFQLSQAESRATNLLAAADLLIVKLPDFNATESSNLVKHGTSLVRLSLAGTDYKVFAQPLLLSLGDDNSKSTWNICGLVRVKDFTAETWELSSTSVIAFVFAATGLLLLWPFLNVAFCGPRGDVRCFEVTWVLVAGFSGCVALTFVLLYSNAYLASEDTSDEQLGELARKVHNNLVDELGRVDQLLTKLDEQLYRDAAKQSTNSSVGWTLVTNRTEVFKDVQAISNDYPTLIEVFWAGTNGNQIAKWTPQKSLTAFIPVKGRDYFHMVTEGFGWPWSGVLANGEPTRTNMFYLESLFSRTRGENVAILSHRFSVTNSWPWEASNVSNNFPRPRVSCISFQPLSVFNPVLPAGYGFCIIDPTGKVLFHSDGRRNLRENFIKEAGRSLRLQAAIHSRTADQFDVRYLNLPHHVSVTPMRGIPWTLVAFRNEHVLDSVHRNMLVTASVVFSLYVLVLLLLIALALIGRRIFDVRDRSSGWLSWLWPSWGLTERLTFLGVTLTGAAVCCVSIFRSKSSLWLAAWGLITPVVTILLAWLVARLVGLIRQAKDHPGTGAYSGSSGAFTCLSSHGLIFVVIAMLPAFACYKIAFLKETELFVKGTQLKLARDLQERPVQMRIKARRGTGSGGNPNYWSHVRQFRLTNPWNRYYDHFGNTSVTNLADSSSFLGDPEWFNKLYVACRPHFDEAELRTSGLLNTKAEDDSWQTHIGESNRLVLTLRGGTDSGTDGEIHVSSRIPTLEWLPWEVPPDPKTAWHVCWYLGLLSALAAPFFFTWFVAQRILLLSLPNTLRRNTSDSRHFLFSGPSMPPKLIAVEEDRFANMEKTHVLLRDSSQVKQLLQEEGWKRMEEGSVVVISPSRDNGVEDQMKSVRKLSMQMDESGSRTVVAIFEQGWENRDLAELMDWRQSLWAVECGYTKTLASNENSTIDRGLVTLRLAREFQSTWTDLTPMEKLTLYQVAQNGFVSSARAEVRTLLDRGLLRFDPELGLRNESFRRFVLAVYRAREIEEKLQLETEAEPSFNWPSIRGAIGIAITVAAMFLFITQQELWQLAVGLAGSFATASQNLSKITGLFQKSNGKSSGTAED